ncbi:MAG TPA: aminotransferase class V-fold PLP-dependent enzyme, partial [Acidimicrobiales bacterium]|nr:aminotransferase class V-fold PLP-dependent enzyme [Acidimicrobiales bacterium]
MKPSDLDPVIDALEAELRPYRDSHVTHRRLPATGLERGTILSEMRELAGREQDKWRSGYASGAVYHGGADHIEFLNEVYGINSQANPLHPELWPSAVKYEAEVVAMTAAMLGGGPEGVESVCGTVSSGGTESILLAMKTYRDQARAERGVKDPEIVVPVSAHAAFDKAAHYFGLKLVPVPLRRDWRADVDAAAKLVNKNTVAVVASAPGFPHGVIDPIAEMAELAASKGIGCHVDGCLGGFVLPWAERLGYPVPVFDFRLPGVTSMSADTHKFGYAAKGTSVVLYRTNELRQFQYYKTATWMGGLYYSPTFAGSRPGALGAEAWAAMLTFGEEGYLVATKAVLETAAVIRRGIEEIPELFVLGDPLWVIALASDEIDVYAVMDQMSARGWSLNGLQNPPAAHICVTLRHAQPGVADRFLADLRSSVALVRETPGL